jgi:hypothetical protein
LKIRKGLKKEKTRKNRVLFISLLIMIIMPYIVVILNDEGVFNLWEFHFALSYAILVDTLLLFYIIKCFAHYDLRFSIHGQKMKIKDGTFKLYFSISLNKLLHVGIVESKNNDFDIFIVMKKGKINKNFKNFNIEYVKEHPRFKDIYENFFKKGETVDYFCVFIKKGGVKKYYLLYSIFKSAYNAEFSTLALDYVKKFMEEYNMS